MSIKVHSRSDYAWMLCFSCACSEYNYISTLKATPWFKPDQVMFAIFDFYIAAIVSMSMICGSRQHDAFFYSGCNLTLYGAAQNDVNRRSTTQIITSTSKPETCQPETCQPTKSFQQSNWVKRLILLTVPMQLLAKGKTLKVWQQTKKKEEYKIISIISLINYKIPPSLQPKG
jgi:hypothetical protein